MFLLEMETYLFLWLTKYKKVCPSISIALITYESKNTDETVEDWYDGHDVVGEAGVGRLVAQRQVAAHNTRTISLVITIDVYQFKEYK